MTKEAIKVKCDRVIYQYEPHRDKTGICGEPLELRPEWGFVPGKDFYVFRLGEIINENSQMNLETAAVLNAKKCHWCGKYFKKGDLVMWTLSFDLCAECGKKFTSKEAQNA
jgi:hypothetical protein